jgi:anti-anti-sigma factor
MLKHQGFAFTVRQTNRYVVVSAEGELDIAATASLRAAVLGAERHTAHVVIDLRDVTFVDTFALRELVNLQHECRRGQTLHVVPGEGIQRVLDLAQARPLLRWIAPEQLAG